MIYDASINRSINPREGRPMCSLTVSVDFFYVLQFSIATAKRRASEVHWRYKIVNVKLVNFI